MPGPSATGRNARSHSSNVGARDHPLGPVCQKVENARASKSPLKGLYNPSLQELYPSPGTSASETRRMGRKTQQSSQNDHLTSGLLVAQLAEHSWRGGRKPYRLAPHRARQLLFSLLPVLPQVGSCPRLFSHRHTT